MKKSWILLGLTMVLMFFASCTDGSINTVDVEASEDKTIADYDEYVGKYFYDYPDRTTDLNEDHYIILKMFEDSLIGYYYGTTDDFDDAREGYQAGFYVSDMKNLTIDKNTICFSVQLYSKDLFTFPVALNYSNSEEVSPGDNKIWINAHIFNHEEGITVVYNGMIENEKIVLKVDDENRVFVKMEE